MEELPKYQVQNVQHDTQVSTQNQDAVGDLQGHSVSKGYPEGIKKDSIKQTLKDIAKNFLHSIAAFFTGSEKTSLGRYHLSKVETTEDIPKLWVQYKVLGDDLLVTSRNRPQSEIIKNKEELKECQKYYEKFKNYAESYKIGDAANIGMVNVPDEFKARKDLSGGICRGVSTYLCHEIGEKGIQNLSTDELIEVCSQGKKGWPKEAAARHAFYGGINISYESKSFYAKVVTSITDKQNAMNEVQHSAGSDVLRYLLEVLNLPSEARPKVLQGDAQLIQKNYGPAVKAYIANRSIKSKENLKNQLAESLQETLLSMPEFEHIDVRLNVLTLLDYVEEYMQLAEDYSNEPVIKEKTWPGDDLISQFVNWVTKKAGSKISYSTFLKNRLDDPEKSIKDEGLSNFIHGVVGNKEHLDKVLSYRVIAQMDGADYRLVEGIKPAIALADDEEYLQQLSSLNEGTYSLSFWQGVTNHVTTIIVKGEGENKEFFFHDPNTGLIRCDPDQPHVNILKCLKGYEPLKKHPMKKIEKGQVFHNCRLMQYIPPDKLDGGNSKNAENQQSQNLSDEEIIEQGMQRSMQPGTGYA